MLKKLISILLCIQLIAISAVPVLADNDAEETVISAETAAEEIVTEEETTEEVVTEEEETLETAEEVEEEPTVLDTNESAALIALGIFNEGDLESAYAHVTRKDFARMIYQFSTNGAGSSAVVYSDIAASDAASVNYAVEQKYIEAPSGDTFNPDEPATAFQFIKAIVSEMGYDSLAKIKNGYVNAAKEIGIIKGALEYDGPITYKEAAKLLYEALLTGESKVVFKHGVNTFEISDTPYIENRFDAKIYKGIIRATDRTCLDKTEGLGTGSVNIGGIEYETAIDLYDYLGYNVKFVTKEINGYDTVIAVFGMDKLNDVLEIPGNNVVSFADNTYTYEYNGRQWKTELDKGKSVIYNGKYLESYTPDMLVPKNGSVKLINGDNAGGYETVVISDYVNFVITMFDENDQIIYDANGSGTVALRNFADYDIIQNGKAINETSLKQNMVLSVAISADGSYACIYASDAVKSGVVDNYYEDTDELYIYIKGEKYDICKDYFKAYTQTSALLPNKDVKVYYDFEGKVVWIEEAESDMKVAFLLRCRYDDDTESINFKMLTQDNDIINVQPVASRVKIDEVTYKKAQSVQEALKKGTSSVIPQLFRYKLNENGEICEIDTPYNDQPPYFNSNTDTVSVPYLTRQTNGTESENSFRMIYGSRFEASPEKMWYKPASRTFGRSEVRFAAKSDTVPVLIRPSDDANVADDNVFFLTVTTGGFNMDAEYTNVDFYSWNGNSRIADLCVRYNDAAMSTNDTIEGYTVGMIKKIMREWNEERGEVVTRMEISGINTETAIAVEDRHWKTVEPTISKYDGETYELGVGDVVWYDRDAMTSEITAIRIMWDASDRDPSTSFKGESFPRQYGDILFYPGVRYFDVYDFEEDYALVTKKDLSTFEFTNESELDLTIERVGFFGGGVMVHLDRSTDKYEVTTSSYGSTYDWKSIKDYKRFGKKRSQIICVTKWGYALNMFVIDD